MCPRRNHLVLALGSGPRSGYRSPHASHAAGFPVTSLEASSPIAADDGVPPAVSSVTIADFLDQVAAARPDPGGGAASAVVLATGVALAEMVAGYSADLLVNDPTLPGRLTALRAEAMSLVGADAAASAGFASAMAIQEGDPARVVAVVTACVTAADSALAIAAVGGRLLTELRLLDRSGERRVHADVRVAAAAVGATIRASVANTQACLQLAQATGATAGDLVDIMRRLADLGELLDLADAIAGTPR